jgi:hypothetical protein
MNRCGKIIIAIACVLVLAAGVRADDVVLPGNPYAPVVPRNIFGLNPPPPPAPPAEADPPAKITPNGIMSIFGQLQVLFKVAGTSKHGGPPPIEESYILSEGQRQDDIEVLKIDEKNGIVTFNNHGETQELPLVVTQPSATPSSAPVSSAGGGSGGRFSPGLANPGGAGRPRSGGYGNNAISSGSGNDGNPNDGPNLRSVPTRGNTFNAADQIPQGMTEEVQTIAIEAERERTRQQVDNGELPPLPITDLTPPNTPEAGGNPDPNAPK